MSKYVKIEYGSSHNVSVGGVEYVEVGDDLLDENGQVPESVVSSVWQEAVNEFMADTCAVVVENEGD